MKLSKTYDAKPYENKIYQLWEKSGSFAAGAHNVGRIDASTCKTDANDNSVGGRPTYSIIMPPPNANGNLHVGHGLMIPIEDVLVRYHRMRGDDTVWIPGADHAGFETWVVFEKWLEKQGKTRFDFTREQLYRMTWDFVHRNRANMENQVRALGASVDWTTNTFTLDDKVVKTVYRTFKKMWDEGLIYRGKRIVNYCPKHHTSFADIEVEFKNEAGHLWQVAYPLVDTDFAKKSGISEIVVATSRPETIFGDVAIAVHPDDKKFAPIIGQKVKVPLISREIPIIADDEVELGFGTGAVKITPAHDPLDFEIGARHDLEALQVIDFDGKIVDKDFIPEIFRGELVDEARKMIVEQLSKQGSLRKVVNYDHEVPHCYKCGTIIEPMLMDQWFVSVSSLAERAKKAVEAGQIRFFPAAKSKEISKYYDELRDWNISRQIPWGIPIPAFQNVDDPDDWIYDTAVNQETIERDGHAYRRDPDTFDTWFSSGQWPFITTDFLDHGRLDKYYPNSVMETGVDLERPWVARMIMLGLYMTDRVPFKDVFFHGLVLDEHGKKMSKSKGNVVNPLDIIEKYGADALRMGIMMNRGAGQPQAFSPATVVAGRNFANKLWNVARFIEGKLPNDYMPDFVKFTDATTPAEHWILRELERARQGIESDIANYNFAEAIDKVYHLLWDSFADWFIEASKDQFRPDFLVFALSQLLRLSHPFTPFITETIWTTLNADDSLLITEPWPDEILFDDAQAEEFDQVRDFVMEIRYVVSQLPNGKYVVIFANSDRLLRRNSALVKTLAHLANIRELGDNEPGRGLRIAVHGREAWIDINEELLYEHQQNLEKRLLEFRENAQKLESRLANKGYVERAPEKLVTETRNELAKAKSQIERLVAELEEK